MDSGHVHLSLKILVNKNNSVFDDSGLILPSINLARSEVLNISHVTGGYQWHKWHNGELAKQNFHLCHEILCHLMQFYAILCHSKYEILKL